MKEYILFDLDGTLTDPKVGITTCVQYALRDLGIEEPDLDKLEPFIGPPLKNSFMEFYNLTEEQADKALEKYRERFGEIGLFENQVYEGIPKMLKNLQSKGMTLAVASSKPTVFVERILEHFDLRKYFKVVVGSELDGTRVEKDEVVREALNRLFSYKPIDRKKVYMIGDRKFDVEGARKLGVESVGVTYGYGSMEELKTARADYIVRSVEELDKLLMREAEALALQREAQQNGIVQSDVSGDTTPQKPKGVFKVFLPFVYAFLIFLVVKSIALNMLKSFLQQLYISLPDSIAEAIFVLDEKGLPGAFTGSATALLNAASYVVGIALVVNMAKALVAKVSEEQKLNYLKPEHPVYYGLTAVVTAGTVIGLNTLLGLLMITTPAQDYQAYIGDESSANLIVGLIAVGIVIPVVEEILFRGILFNRLRRNYKLPRAMILSVAFYAVYQLDSVESVYALVMGSLIIYAYVYFGKFWVAIAVHVMAAIIEYVITYTALAESALYSWPVCLTAAAAALISFLVLSKRKKML